MKKKLLIWIILAVVIAATVAGIWGYKALLRDNVKDHPNGFHELYVSTEWNYDSLKSALDTILIRPFEFDLFANRMNLPNRVIPGKYHIQNNLGNRQLIVKLRSGSSEQVKVLLKGSVDRSSIIREISTALMPDSNDYYHYLDTSSHLKSLGYNKENWPCMMMANTYFFDWATDVTETFNRFQKEKELFWNAHRKAKLEKLNLTINEALILASIVDAETMRDSELKRIAGVYLNRLQRGWPLQADPTVRYIAHTKGRQRVLKVDLKVESPYNTYLYKGLPPGPVLLPSVKSVDAVLEAESHNYMFFCAKADLSGFHLFTASAKEHERNAVRYHKALDARNIRE